MNLIELALNLIKIFSKETNYGFKFKVHKKNNTEKGDKKINNEFNCEFNCKIN